MLAVAIKSLTVWSFMNEKQTILLVDDSENDLLLMRMTFKAAKFNNPLQEVHNGEEAIAYVKGEGPYGDHTGFSLAKKLKPITKPGGSIRGEAIADPRFGDENFRARRVGFNFLAQVGDVNAQVVRVLVVAWSPNFAEDLTVREDFS